MYLPATIFNSILRYRDPSRSRTRGRSVSGNLIHGRDYVITGSRALRAACQSARSQNRRSRRSNLAAVDQYLVDRELKVSASTAPRGRRFYLVQYQLHGRRGWIGWSTQPAPIAAYAALALAARAQDGG
jgi:hypothetical protein